jgi:hypothetical protein
MDRREALAVLGQVLESYRARAYSELRSMMGETHVQRIVAESGISYWVTVEVVCERDRRGPLRIQGTVDDGGWRSLWPLARNVLREPEQAP